MSDLVPPLVIEPSRGTLVRALGEVVACRELLYFLAWRDFKVRYKQTLLGAAWAVIQPVATMVVFSLVFGRLAGMPSDGVPYPLFSYAALVPWTYFSTALSSGSAALVGGQHIISKVYFPRVLMPAAAVVTPLADMTIALTLTVGIGAWYGIWPSVHVIWLPVFTLLAVVSALGAGLWLSALTVTYRDVRYVLAFLVQFWLFITPVAYPSSLVPEAWRPFYGLNPMATVVEGFRWAMAAGPGPDATMAAASVASALVLLVSGLWFFQRAEAVAADVL
jgi:lipopolysaccharide transport system permease protein